MRHPTEKISVHKTKDFPVAQFVVEVGEGSTATSHHVTFKQEYYDTLTNGTVDPEDLVQRSFQFLLEREPKESILAAFDLSIIQTYFSEFEEVISATVSN